MTTTVQTNKPVLQLGSQGTAVKELQALINQCSDYNLTVDGIFGEKTKAAVQGIQDRFFLVVDGIVGAKTWNVLLTRKTPELPVLRMGSRGDLVRRVQQRLSMNGYSLGAIDGEFGSKTEAAVKRFQADRYLVVDGIIGQQTWSQLSHIGIHGC